MKKIILYIPLVMLWFSSSAYSQMTVEKPRTIITTDGEIDDVDSFIRMLLYSNEFQIEGLVYSSSMWHYKGDGKGTKFVSEMEMTKELYGEKTDLRWPGTQWMQGLIDAYEKVYSNLILHSEGFPTASYLRSLIKVGNIDFEGEMVKDTEGSDFIKEKLLDDNLTSLYLQVWGGTNTIARALKSIEDEFKSTMRWQKIQKKVSGKAILFTILDQDATYKKYIEKAWPDIKVYYNSNQFWSLAYNWKKAIPKVWHQYLEGGFMGEHIINGHGPLTKMYYSYGDGQKQEGDDEHIHGDPTKLVNAQWGTFNKYDFISEGDSPAFLHLIDVGLDNLEHPDYGGWGGRLRQSKTNVNRWEDGKEVAEINPFTQKLDNAYPQTRWIKALQMDFAARADWCVKAFSEANHAPIVELNGTNQIKVKPNETIQLIAKATDPDGDILTYSWWQYKEAGTYMGNVAISNPENMGVSLKIPSDLKKDETIHIILEVTDNQFPNMTRYQRVVLTSE
ncbi:MAG: nucleoside hydrolase-like domain-containing protein [Maribacter sp.]